MSNLKNGPTDLPVLTTNNPTHDKNYLIYLQQSYGTVAIPFFGFVICIVTFLGILLLILLNISVNLLSNKMDKNCTSGVSEILQTNMPIIY